MDWHWRIGIFLAQIHRLDRGKVEDEHRGWRPPGVQARDQSWKRDVLLPSFRDSKGFGERVMIFESDGR